ncbi:hypothetical protein DI53_1249 [Sphingobacterium deserti]|uniref:Uncharacterized protein n=1 Tax=Sphingobacterium deserti TaxID=1229276 RepID=A0A0B8T1N7_9SPHI|nr:hypothetical protein DI53_1249 [Sphingobacterium deserti]
MREGETDNSIYLRFSFRFFPQHVGSMRLQKINKHEQTIYCRKLEYTR